MSAFFSHSLNEDTGEIYMKRGAPSETLLVKVSDSKHNKEVIRTIQVDMNYIYEDAVRSSGSFRFEGMIY